MWITQPFTHKTFFQYQDKNQRGKNRVVVEGDAYGFERTLAFATIHPWVK